MNQYNGEIFSGELGQDYFYLNSVKNIETSSTLSKRQLKRLSKYLMEQNNSFTITVNDQLPVLLQNEELQYLMEELEEILQELES